MATKKPKKQNDWTIFLTSYRTEYKGTGDFMSSAAEAYGKLTDAQKKAAPVPASLTSDWARFLHEFRAKNQGKFVPADMMFSAGEVWKEMSDAQKAAYDPKKDVAQKDTAKKDAPKK